MNTLTLQDLQQFTGTENYYRHGLVSSITYTDGARYLAEHGGAYWLLDEIATGQMIREVRAVPFQAWKLTVNADQTAVLVCEDGNHHIMFEKKIEFTDFPLPEVRLWFQNNVIFLPSEY